MAAAFSFAYSFLKAETLGRDAMMEAMSNNMTKPDKYGNTRQMTVRQNRDPSAALAGKLVHEQERMRTGDINDPDHEEMYDDRDGGSMGIGEDGDSSYDLSTTEDRELNPEYPGSDVGSFMNNMTEQELRAHLAVRRRERDARQGLTSQGLNHADYKLNPETGEAMKKAWSILKEKDDNYDAMTECSNCGKPANALSDAGGTAHPDEEVWCESCLGTQEID